MYLAELRTVTLQPAHTMVHLHYSKFGSLTLVHSDVRPRNVPKTGVLGVQKVFRLAFAHFLELRMIICALDSQRPVFFIRVGIKSV